MAADIASINLIEENSRYNFFSFASPPDSVASDRGTLFHESDHVPLHIYVYLLFTC